MTPQQIEAAAQAVAQYIADILSAERAEPGSHATMRLHHCWGDGWSKGCWWQDVARILRHIQDGQPAAKPEPLPPVDPTKLIAGPDETEASRAYRANYERKFHTAKTWKDDQEAKAKQAQKRK